MEDVLALFSVYGLQLRIMRVVEPGLPSGEKAVNSWLNDGLIPKKDRHLNQKLAKLEVSN